MTQKTPWQGTLMAVQPRIRLLRSFDERSHTYLGYVLKVHGSIGGHEREFLVGIGQAAQAKFQFRTGDSVSGESLPVADPRTEPVEYYKTSKLKLIARQPESQDGPPPWHKAPPDLPTYRGRGHRRLDARTFAGKCSTCIWACRMPVEMIIDQWNPQQRRYRFETFCYGPKSCPSYRSGATRKVPGRKGMVWEEEDWVDEDAISHRGLDE